MTGQEPHNVLGFSSLLGASMWLPSRLTAQSRQYRTDDYEGNELPEEEVGCRSAEQGREEKNQPAATSRNHVPTGASSHKERISVF